MTVYSEEPIVAPSKRYFAFTGAWLLAGAAAGVASLALAAPFPTGGAPSFLMPNASSRTVPVMGAAEPKAARGDLIGVLGEGEPGIEPPLPTNHKQVALELDRLLTTEPWCILLIGDGRLKSGRVVGRPEADAAVWTGA